MQLWHLEKRAILFITHDVDEAIFLADRIMLMSARPGRVAQTWDVTVARPRNDSSRTDNAFMELKRDILVALRANTKLEIQ